MPARRRPRSRESAPPLLTYTLDNWRVGERTEIFPGRGSDNAVSQSHNMVLNQDGVLQPRPKLIPYAGGILPGRLLGQLYSFYHHSLGVEILIGCFKKADDSVVLGSWKKGDDEWRELTADNWDNDSDNPVSFLATDFLITEFDHGDGVDKTSENPVPHVLVFGGSVRTRSIHDDLNEHEFKQSVGYINLTKDYDAWEVVGANEGVKIPQGLNISASFGSQLLTQFPNLANNDRTTYTYYYTVLGTFGESAPSRAVSVQHPVLRHEWGRYALGGAPVTFEFGANIIDSDRKRIYLSVDNGLPVFLKEVTGSSYYDSGTDVPDDTRLMPTHNGQILPDVSYGRLINGRTLLYGDKDNPRRIHYTDNDNILSVAPSLTTGYRDVSTDESEEVTYVGAATSGSDQFQGIHVLTRSRQNQEGKRYILRAVRFSREDGFFEEGFSIDEVESTGTMAPFGVVNYLNNLYYPSKGGFKTTGPKPGLHNILATDEISQTIRHSYLALHIDNMVNCVGAVLGQKIYWAVPTESDTPDRVWVMDLTQGLGSWMIGLDLQADFLLTTIDENDEETLLVIQGETINRFTENLTAQEDFKWVVKSIQLKPQGEIVKMAFYKAYFDLYHIRGQIRVTIWARTEEGVEQTLATVVLPTAAEPNTDTTRTSGFDKIPWDISKWGQAPPTKNRIRPIQSVPSKYIIPLVGFAGQFIGFTIENATPDAFVIISKFSLAYGNAGPTDLGVELDA